MGIFDQSCIKAPKTILDLSWQTFVSSVKFCLFQLVFCMFMFIWFIFHSLFQKEIIATYNQPACIIIALLKYIYCLKFFSQVRDVAHGPLVYFESWDVIFTRSLLKKWWDAEAWVLSLDQRRLFQWRLSGRDFFLLVFYTSTNLWEKIRNLLKLLELVKLKKIR